VEHHPERRARRTRGPAPRSQARPARLPRHPRLLRTCEGAAPVPAPDVRRERRRDDRPRVRRGDPGGAVHVLRVRPDARPRPPDHPEAPGPGRGDDLEVPAGEPGRGLAAQPTFARPPGLGRPGVEGLSGRGARDRADDQVRGRQPGQGALAAAELGVRRPVRRLAPSQAARSL
ncbi:MAG: hypothetical protein AVDCRST_MAG64-2545, partial [uncultured Phycisphaerae bacterium]